MAASLRAHHAALQRKIDEAATLYDVGREIAGQIALEPTLHLIVERSRALLQADASLVALRVGTTDTFEMRAHSGSVTEALRKLDFDPGEGLGGQVVATGTAMTVGDYLAEYPDSPFLEMVREVGLHSAVAVPLKVHDTVSGVLYVHSQEPHKFQVEDQRLLSALANQAVIAIENAKLYENVKRHAEELEAKVEERTRELQEASRHKSQFLASMSHELRTPMNAVLGYTELILDGEFGELNDDLRDAIERVQRSGRHLLGLINDVLDLSKIEAGRFILTLGEYSMKRVVQAVFTAVHPLASAKNLPLELVVPSDLPPGWGDERRITQVLLNLVGNAIKFTDSGAVTVRVAVQDGTFMVSVVDTGPGIPEVDQQRIFDEFQQADSSHTRKKGGTGLGLSIAKRIVEMHDGHIGVNSTPGKGSTFWFTLPVRVERREAVR